MRDVVICEPVRTAVGRYGGLFVDVMGIGGGQGLRAIIERIDE
jgi:hypothetical protein